jgi:two-component system sensor histidine kinase MprB
MSLRWRLALVVGVIFAVVVVGCVFAAHLSASQELRAETDRFLQSRANDPRLQEGFGPGRNPGGPNGPFQLPTSNVDQTQPPQRRFVQPDVIIQTINANGTVDRASSPQLPVDKHDAAMASAAAPPRLRTVTVDGTPYRVITVHTPSGAVQLARSIQETNDVLSTLDIRLLLIALGGTVVAALLAWVIARRIVRPIEQLTGATEAVAETQDLEREITVDRRDELGRLATSFNTMLVALRTSRDQQKRLVMDASHELRTPLTALRTNIEVLQRNTALDDAQRTEMLGEVESELHELGDLVAELVDLATDARTEEPMQRVDLADVADRAVARFRRRTGREITLTVSGRTEVTARPGAIERAIGNLVENACKFSTAPVDVRVDGNRVDVADRGPGIAADDQVHVFDRFYRAPAARTMPGSGLGLAIVKQIADLHAGSIELLPRDGGGTIARLTLPA